MGNSINRSQAEALADGFLNNVGDDKGFRPKEVYTELILLAGELLISAQNNLNATNSNASGKLSASLEVQEPQQSGSILKTDVTMLTYGQYVNKGVKGVVSGQGKFSFKNLGVSKKMIASLIQSKSKASNKISSTNTKKSISRNEKKNQSISDIASVFGAAVNIKKFGIKPTGFIDKAIVTTEQKVQDRLGKALKVDIINSMNNL